MKTLLGVIFVISLLGCSSGSGESSPTTPSATVNMSGTYSGSWSSAVVLQSGSLVATFTQSGSTMSGTIGIGNSPCFSTGNIQNGTVSGNILTWSSSGIGSFSGTLNGNTITGTYNVTLAGVCYGDHGTFTVSK